MKSRINVGKAVCVVVSIAWLSACAPPADYGDAPDGGATGYPAGFAQTGGFPTMFASNGARTLAVDEAVLGAAASLEIDAVDPADPDGQPNLNPVNTDSDDGISDLHLKLTSIPPPAELAVVVSAPAGAPGGTYYLNVLIDLNMDGRWGGTASGGEPEWVVQNFAVTLTPGSSSTVKTPAFAYANGFRLPDGVWMRIALTREQVAVLDWDGTGEFSAGEIEDHVITLPEIDGKQHPILVVDCDGPYSFGANNVIGVACTVFNLRNAPGTFTYTLTRLSGGVAVAPLQGGPLGIGALGWTVVGLTARKGALPSEWLFVATPDPAAVVTAEGVTLGHSETSCTIAFSDGADEDGDDNETGGEDNETGGEDNETVPGKDVFVGSLEGFYEHFEGYSELTALVTVLDDAAAAVDNATVSLRLNGPDNATGTQSAVTDADGLAETVFTIYSYGTYTAEVTDITGEQVRYVPEKNVVTSITLEVE